MAILLTRVTSMLIFAAGVVTFPLPIPIGLLLMAIGLALMASTSPSLLRRLQRFRSRHPRLNRGLERIEPKLFGRLQDTLRRSRPERGAPELGNAAAGSPEH
ncbi:MAG: hypothetical protein AAGD14_11695 [Planctomycetota bacterium]